nr:MAG TPA: hypothetical protein [Caudoviricetes sp.]
MSIFRIISWFLLMYFLQLFTYFSKLWCPQRTPSFINIISF